MDIVIINILSTIFYFIIIGLWRYYESDKSEIYYNGIDFYINIFFFVFTPILNILACFLWCVLTLAALEILGFLFEHRILQMMNTKMYVYKRDGDIRDDWN